MKTLAPLFFLLSFTACSTPQVEEHFFRDTRQLQQSSLFKTGHIPKAFVDVLPPSVEDIHERHSSADTITHLKFRLANLPEGYLALTSRMEPVSQPEVEKLHPFHPAEVEWWNAPEVERKFGNDEFVFRKLPCGEGRAVYVAASEAGNVYAWISH